MKKIKKITKNVAKVLGTTAIATVTLFSAAVTVQAYDTVTLGKKWNVALDVDQTLHEASQMYGYFETHNDQHRARAGTHFNPGNLSGAAYTELYYNTSSSNEEKIVSANGYVTGSPNSWIRAKWVEAPVGYTAASSIAFVGDKINDYGVLIVKEVTYVNRSTVTRK